MKRACLSTQCYVCSLLWPQQILSFLCLQEACLWQDCVLKELQHSVWFGLV